MAHGDIKFSSILNISFKWIRPKCDHLKDHEGDIKVTLRLIFEKWVIRDGK
jgi:hypothetical protein